MTLPHRGWEALRQWGADAARIEPLKVRVVLDRAIGARLA